MEKRLIIAIALSMLVLLAWSGLAPKEPQPAPVQESKVSQVATQSQKTAISKRDLDKELSSFEESISEETPLNLATEKSDYIFSESTAALIDTVFTEYQTAEFSLKYGFLIKDEDLLFRERSSGHNKISFVHRDGGKEIKKDFIFDGDTYGGEFILKIKNMSNLKLKMDIPLVLGVMNFKDPLQSRFQSVFVSTKDRERHVSPKKEIEIEGAQIVGLRDKYFCLIVQSDYPEEQSSVYVKRLNGKESEVGLFLDDLALQPEEETTIKFQIYLGPQDLDQINLVNKGWGSIVHYGTFDFISQLLLQLLTFFHNIVHNWGLAIIMLSFSVYLILFPITLKQMRSMKGMQVLQPRIEELRKQHKDDPKKLNKETMELWKEHKVNPFGGCLPLILQMPVFFALYQALARSVALKGANFLWIKDLSEPDKLFKLPFTLPILGSYFNILPIMMALLMVFQQKITMGRGGAGSAEQQKVMMMVMPLMFGIIFYNMPAGLVLYWFTNSLLMTMYQFKINRMK